MTYTIGMVRSRQFLEHGLRVSTDFDFGARLFQCSGHHMVAIYCKASYGNLCPVLCIHDDKSVIIQPTHINLLFSLTGENYIKIMVKKVLDVNRQ